MEEEFEIIRGLREASITNILQEEEVEYHTFWENEKKNQDSHINTPSPTKLMHTSPGLKIIIKDCLPWLRERVKP